MSKILVSRMHLRLKTSKRLLRKPVAEKQKKFRDMCKPHGVWHFAGNVFLVFDGIKIRIEKRKLRSELRYELYKGNSSIGNSKELFVEGNVRQRKKRKRIKKIGLIKSIESMISDREKLIRVFEKRKTMNEYTKANYLMEIDRIEESLKIPKDSRYMRKFDNNTEFH